MCFPLESTKAPSNQTSMLQRGQRRFALQEHPSNRHAKLTRHNVVLTLRDIRDCRETARDSREREREREARGEAEERRGEERRGEREREREERKNGEQLRRCKHRKTVRSTTKVVKATGPATLPAPINSCCNGIRDNLRVEKESALELLCEAGPHWEQAGCE